MKQKLEAKCIDCGMSYDKFGMDMTLPNEQWELIHPGKDGLLCSQCIINRVSKINSSIAIRAIIEFLPNSNALSQPINVPQFRILLGGTASQIEILMPLLELRYKIAWECFHKATDISGQKTYLEMIDEVNKKISISLGLLPS